jgi:hypothetical protein
MIIIGLAVTIIAVIFIVLFVCFIIDLTRKEKFTFDDNANNDLVTLIGPDSWYDIKSLDDFINGKIQPLKEENAALKASLTTIQANLQNQVTVLPKNIVNLIYPVGTIKVSFTNINPQSYLSGTVWILISSGYYIKSSNGSDAGSTGGSSSTTFSSTSGTTTLSLSQIPSHSHSINLSTSSAGGGKMGGLLSYAGWYVTSNGVCVPSTNNYRCHGLENGSGCSDNYTWTINPHTHTVSGTSGASGGSTGHSHTISGTISITPLFINICFWRRTA